jgi:hypothetical protein
MIDLIDGKLSRERHWQLRTIRCQLYRTDPNKDKTGFHFYRIGSDGTVISVKTLARNKRKSLFVEGTGYFRFFTA